ncbi:MAG: hypothetical protein D6760_07900 [Deltaproteobacteria bacterium]|nr:MAG: hypothetical protein D6760_07900 [Deltaproteobacteria bacterium]
MGCLLGAGTAWAGPADVVGVHVEPQGAAAYRFAVTVRHDDENWIHYADRWEVRTLAGKLLAVRVLLHPHLREQPFTRDLAGVVVPPNTAAVIVRAHDTIHDYDGRSMRVELPAPADTRSRGK